MTIDATTYKYFSWQVESLQGKLNYNCFVKQNNTKESALVTVEMSVMIPDFLYQEYLYILVQYVLLGILHVVAISWIFFFLS